MNLRHSLCIKTPAGETHTIPIEYAETPDYAVHAPLRVGVSHALKWVDDHVKWERGVEPYPQLLKAFHGPGDWEIRMHLSERQCPLCQSK